eukprot:GEMP01015648.1.p1 GENE.GEMP01015648.1~~GEMP01015648.1.p1  ORF type:complete len:373 (-),score=82.40 GEMP01015648.1:1767-2885(-)
MNSELVALGVYYAKVSEAAAQFSALLFAANEEARSANLPSDVTENFDALAYTMASIGEAAQRDLAVDAFLMQMDIQRRIVNVLWAQLEFNQRENQKRTARMGSHGRHEALSDTLARELMDNVKLEQRHFEEMEHRLGREKKTSLVAAMRQNMDTAIESSVCPKAHTAVGEYWRKVFPDYYQMRIDLQRANDLLKQAQSISGRVDSPDKDLSKRLLRFSLAYRGQVNRALAAACRGSGHQLIFPVDHVNEALEKFQSELDGGDEKPKWESIEAKARGPYVIEGLWIRDQAVVKRGEEAQPVGLAIWQLGNHSKVHILHLASKGPEYRSMALNELDQFFLCNFPVDRVQWDMDADDDASSSAGSAVSSSSSGAD